MLREIPRLVTQIPASDINGNPGGIEEFHKTGCRRKNLVNHDTGHRRGCDTETRSKNTVGTRIIGLMHFSRNHIRPNHQSGTIVAGNTQLLGGIGHCPRRAVLPVSIGRRSKTSNRISVQVKVGTIVIDHINRDRRARRRARISEFLAEIIRQVIRIIIAVEQGGIKTRFGKR